MANIFVVLVLGYVLRLGRQVWIDPPVAVGNILSMVYTLNTLHMYRVGICRNIGVNGCE